MCFQMAVVPCFKWRNQLPVFLIVGRLVLQEQRSDSKHNLWRHPNGCVFLKNAHWLSTILTEIGCVQSPLRPHVSEIGAPREGWVKINFDAHIGTSLQRGLGVMVRDHSGNVLLTGTRCIEANWSVLISEAAAAVFALEIARRFGYDNVHLEGDSLTVIKAISRQDRGYAHIHLLFDQLIRSAFNFNAFSCSFVRRHGNTVAHMVARWDTGFANEKICIEPFPLSLLTLVDLDR